MATSKDASAKDTVSPEDAPAIDLLAKVKVRFFAVMGMEGQSHFMASDTNGKMFNIPFETDVELPMTVLQNIDHAVSKIYDGQDGSFKLVNRFPYQRLSA